MKSIHQALLWEWYARGFILFPALLLMGFALPASVCGILLQLGLDPESRSLLELHFVMLPIIIFLFVVQQYFTQGLPSRLFLRPISTWNLAAWHFGLGCVVVAAETAVVIAALNFLFGANWPILGPSLIALMAFAMAQSSSSMRSTSVWGIGIAAVAFVALWGFYSSKYGVAYSGPVRFWRQVSGSDVTVALVVCVTCYALTVFFMNRERRGEPWNLQTGFWRWILKTWEARRSSAAAALPSFSSMHSAQEWYHWRQKGLVFPGLAIAVFGIASLGMIIAAVTSLYRHESIPHLVAGFPEVAFGCGVLLIVLSVPVGLFWGVGVSGGSARQRDITLGEVFVPRDNPADGGWMSGHQATLPLSSRQLAWPVIKCVARSVLLADLAWAGFSAMVLLIAWIAGREFLPDRLNEMGFKEVPRSPLALIAVLVGMPLIHWVITANLAVIGLSGRLVRFCYLFTAALFVHAIASVCLQEFVSKEAAQWLNGSVIVVIFMAIIGGFLMACYACLRLQMLSRVHVALALIVSSVVFVIQFAVFPSSLGFLPRLSHLTLAVLVTSPWVLCPLAIHWNRHR